MGTEYLRLERTKNLAAKLGMALLKLTGLGGVEHQVIKPKRNQKSILTAVMIKTPEMGLKVDDLGRVLMLATVGTVSVC